VPSTPPQFQEEANHLSIVLEYTVYLKHDSLIFSLKQLEVKYEFPVNFLSAFHPASCDPDLIRQDTPFEGPDGFGFFSKLRAARRRDENVALGI